MAERADHAVEEGLAADKAMIGTRGRLAGEMLACPEADLEFERTAVTEEDLGIERARFGHANLRKESLDEFGLALAELMALAAAVEATDGNGIGHGSAVSVPGGEDKR